MATLLCSDGAIDDHSRVAYAQVLTNEDVASTCAFLRAAVAYYAGFGVRIREILTDNGGCYRSHELPAPVRPWG